MEKIVTGDWSQSINGAVMYCQFMYLFLHNSAEELHALIQQCSIFITSY